MHSSYTAATNQSSVAGEPYHTLPVYGDVFFCASISRSVVLPDPLGPAT